MIERISLLVLAVLFCACGGVSSSQGDAAEGLMVPQRDTLHEQYEAMIRDFLVGKRVASLVDVMSPDSVPRGRNVLLVYHGMDCGSCLDAGFASLGRLRSKGVPCVAVAIDANVSEAQQCYGYYDYIYTDRRDLLRRELKYVNTPILILLDDSLRIVTLHKPGAGQQHAASVFETAATRLR